MAEGMFWDKFMVARVNRRRLLGSGAALSGGVASVFVLGCGSDKDEQDQEQLPTSSGTAGEPRQGGTLGTYFSNMANYNPFANVHDGNNNSGVTVYDRMLTSRLDKRGYILGAASKLELAEPTKLVMTLAPNMVFQNKEPVNGRPVKASDIVASQNYIRQLPNAYDSSFQRVSLDRAEASDDQTVIYHLKQPSAYLFGGTVLGNPHGQAIVPQEMLAVLDTQPAVGSGPWELVDHTFSVRYAYKRFDKFREAAKKRPYIDQRVTVSLTDDVAREAAFRSEQIHSWTVPPSNVDRLSSELDKSKYTYLGFLSINQNQALPMMDPSVGPRPWHDVRFREAMYRVINRQQYVDLAFGGKAVIPSGTIPASLDAYQLDPKETEKYYKNDLAIAKQLISAMNYDTSKEWQAVCSASNPYNTTSAEVFQQQMSQLGIKIRVNAGPIAEILKSTSQGQFDFYLGSNPGSDTPKRPIRAFHSDTGDQINHTGQFSKDLDALILKSESTTDRDENIKLVKQIQMEALKQFAGAYTFLTQQQFQFYSAKLQNFEVDAIQGSVYNTAAWFS